MKKIKSILIFVVAFAMTSLSFPTGRAQGTPSVTGMVKTQAGQPAHAFLSIHNENFSFESGGETNAEGQFQIFGVPAGNYFLDVHSTFDSQFIPPDPIPVTVPGTGSIDVGIITVTQGSKTIQGRIMRDDGTPVNGARINAFKQSMNGFANSNSNAQGYYNVSVTGGEWEVMPEKDDQNNQADKSWMYSGMPLRIGFADNSAPETKTLNFNVVKTNSTIKGIVKYPDGTFPQWGRVDAHSFEGLGSGANVINGRFDIPIVAGTYEVSVFVQDQSYGTPNLDPVRVQNGQVVNMGVITLIKKDAKVRGQVTDKAGSPIAGLRVNTWRMKGGGWGEAITDSRGIYEILLTAGEWEIMPSQNPESSYVFSGKPFRFEVEKGGIQRGVDFRMTLADSIIKVRAVDDDENTVNVDGFADIFKGDGEKVEGPGFGAPLQSGIATIRVPHGTYNASIFMHPGSDYTAVEKKTVTAAVNDTSTVTIRVKQNDAVINGRLVDEDGNTVTGLNAEVFAHNGEGAFKFSHIEENGTYRLPVIAGTWFMGFGIKEGDSFVGFFSHSDKVNIESNATIEKNFKVYKADSEIIGKVTGPDGNGLARVFVFAETDLVPSETNINKGFEQGGGLGVGTETDSEGNFSLKVPSGQWGVGSHAPKSMNLISPRIQEITAESGKAARVSMNYRVSDAKVSGQVTLNGNGQRAFIWAWSEGGFSESFANDDGSYELNITKGEDWHIGAGMDIDENFYRSDESVVRAGDDGVVSQNLVLKKAPFILPPALTVSFDASQQKVIRLEDGMEILIPAGAIQSSGTIRMTITPTAELPHQKGSKPVGYGYDISAFDEDGALIDSNFNSDVVITIPYTDEMLADAGIEESQLLSSYIDKTYGQWTNVTGASQNEEENKIVFTINHFSEFSLTATPDSTPPADPTDISVSTSTTANALDLAWTNPTDADFAGTNIYRSTALGTLGTKIQSSLNGTTYTDTGLTSGTTYYYTLRAVDNASNESTNTTQYSGTPSGTLPETGSIARTSGSLHVVVSSLAGVFILLGAGFVVARKKLI